MLFGMVYLVAMLALFPARWLHQQFEPMLPRVGSVQGSLWQGTVENVQLPLSLRQLQWRWSPLSTLQGRLGYRLALGEGDASVLVQWGPGQQLYLENLNLQGQLNDWFGSFYGAPLPLNLAVDAKLKQAVLGPQGCVSIDAAEIRVTQWQGLMADTLNRLGPVEAKLSCDDGVVNATLNSEVGLQGHWRLQPNRQYSLELQVDRPDSELRSQLKLLGFRAAGNGLRLRRKGRL
jgi:hypothetical protein